MRTTSLPGKYRRYNAAKKGVRAKDVAAAAPALKVKQIGGAKNGGKRTVLPKSAKYYPADDEKKPKYVRTKSKAVVSAQTAKLRPTITPGSVLILLSGRFRGKRVVFLKQLEKSGLLLVSGAPRCRAGTRRATRARAPRARGARGLVVPPGARAWIGTPWLSCRAEWPSLVLAPRPRRARAWLTARAARAVPLPRALCRAGPFKVNGVPLRRVNQAYVIATSTKVDVSGLSGDLAKFDDAYFARAKKAKKSDEEFFAEKGAKPEIDPKRVADQKAVDDKLMAKISAKPNLKEYLSARFSLSKNERPHEMKF